ncbi:MAG: threonyl-tRNA synthetase editing domain-containing protein [Candidatus Thorarchaeota archaeon]
MRLLMLHVESFWYRPNESTSEERTEIGESLHVWIHSEKNDEENQSGILRKMVKNVRWLAKKIDCNTVTLHSFAHLDDSKADPDFADSLIEEVASKLRDREYDVHIVPFGHFYEFNLHVKGPSLAKRVRCIISYSPPCDSQSMLCPYVAQTLCKQS